MRTPLAIKLFLASCLATSASFGTAAFAQLTPELGVPFPQDKKKAVAIDIKNVRPAIMAWWLDPKNSEVPAEFQIPETTMKDVPLPKEQLDELRPIRDYELPQGIEKIVPIDPQNAIMIYGTEEAIAEIKQTIAKIDLPLRKVEVELQYLTVPSKYSEQLGLTPITLTNFTGEMKPVAVPTDYQKRVQTLIDEGKGRIIASPRMFSINKASGGMSTIVDEAFGLTTDEVGNPKTVVNEEIAKTQALFNFRLRRIWGVSVLPKIQDNGTIDLKLISKLDYEVYELKLKQEISKHFSSDTQTFKGLNEGEVVVLTGSNMRSVMGSGTTDDQLVISLRAREIKGIG